MPLKWIYSFHAAGKDEDELSFDDIYKHMNNIEKLEDKFSKKSGTGSTRLNSNNGSSNGSHATHQQQQKWQFWKTQ